MEVVQMKAKREGLSTEQFRKLGQLLRQGMSYAKALEAVKKQNQEQAQ
jgi:hypothetical protein